MVRSTWSELTADLADADLKLLSAYRNLALSMGADVEERVSRTEVAFARTRIFTSGFILSHRLEIAVDLVREVTHPLLLAAFATTKSVITHRLRLRTLADLASVEDLIAESYDTVGPGFRRPRS